MDKFIVSIIDKNGTSILNQHKNFFDVEIDGGATGEIIISTPFEYDFNFIKIGPTGVTGEFKFYCDLSETEVPSWNLLYAEAITGVTMHNKLFDQRESFVGNTRVTIKNTTGATVVFRVMLSVSIGSAMPFRRR